MPTYQQLIDGNIIGIIDSYDAIHSKFTGEELQCHGEIWPNQTHKRWRWNWNKGLHWFTIECKLTSIECDNVREHLTKKYNIPFWDNGFHDIEFIMQQAKLENEN